MHHRKQACAWVIDTIRACYRAGLCLPFGGTPPPAPEAVFSMTAFRPSALLRHRLGVWLLAALTLWGACAPVLVRAQAAGAGMVGMEVCSAMVGGMHADAAVPGEDPASQADLAMQCPWCLMALSLALALPAQGMVTLLADPVQAPPTADRCANGARSAWVVLPPPRGPPATQTL